MFLRRKGEVPVESEKLTVLKALFGHLNQSVRERNTGFTQVFHRFFTGFSQFSHRISSSREIVFFVELCSDQFY